MEGFKQFLLSGDKYFVNGILGTFIFCVVVYIIGFIAKKVVNRYIDHKIEKYGRDAETTYGFLRSVSRMLINFVVIFLMLMEIKSLQRLGATFVGASGILAVILGFAAQESMSNFIGGFFLSYYKPFKVGDTINLPEKNLVGIVEEIGIRHTVVKTFASSRIVVPNSVMNSEIIENRSSDSKKYCNFLFINISYTSDIEKASKIIQDLAIEHANCIDVRTKKEKENDVPIVPVIVTALKEYAIELRAAIYSKDVGLGFVMSCDLRKQIKEKFDEEGIQIPLPTQTIQLEK